MEDTQVEVKDARRFTDDGERKHPQQKYEIVPRNKWVLIRQVLQGERVSEGGVIITGSQKSQRGIIEAVPDGLGLNVGDLVVYTAFPTLLQDIEDLTGADDLHLVREEEIFFVAVPCQ
jgi:co-chaperonin GroES (HSP10)